MCNIKYILNPHSFQFYLKKKKNNEKTKKMTVKDAITYEKNI